MTTLYEYDGRLFPSKEEAMTYADEKLRMFLDTRVKFVWDKHCVIGMRTPTVQWYGIFGPPAHELKFIAIITERKVG